MIIAHTADSLAVVQTIVFAGAIADGAHKAVGEVWSDCIRVICTAIIDDSAIESRFLYTKPSTAILVSKKNDED